MRRSVPFIFKMNFIFHNRSGIEQNNIQMFYDYLVNDLLAKHFLTGADKQSTFGMICKRESHITLLQDGHIYDSSCPAMCNNNSDAGNICVLSDSTETEKVSCMSSSSTTTIDENGKERNNMYRKFHMLIYKAEQTYLTLLIPGMLPILYIGLFYGQMQIISYYFIHVYF